MSAIQFHVDIPWAQHQLSMYNICITCIVSSYFNQEKDQLVAFYMIEQLLRLIVCSTSTCVCTLLSGADQMLGAGSAGDSDTWRLGWEDNEVLYLLYKEEGLLILF